jgi:hypothetical protein
MQHLGSGIHSHVLDLLQNIEGMFFFVGRGATPQNVD